eukprot:461434-Pelagomonas_calceolata.AAC.7
MAILACVLAPRERGLQIGCTPSALLSRPASLNLMVTLTTAVLLPLASPFVLIFLCLRLLVSLERATVCAKRCTA